jgi:hypothetical protein
MKPSPTSSLASGDAVAWIATRARGAGSGCIAEEIDPAPNGERRFRIAQLVRGEPTGVHLELAEGEFYRTRSIHDPTPLPEALAHPPRR